MCSLHLCTLRELDKAKTTRTKALQRTYWKCIWGHSIEPHWASVSQYMKMGMIVPPDH